MQIKDKINRTGLNINPRIAAPRLFPREDEEDEY
jgi:hypothetical protein